jgi:sterol desaturase/sphingolipid hydroxylase (fatty acid hydroxylase superfamily)
VILEVLWQRVLAGLSSLAVLVVVFVPLERAFPARRAQKVLRKELLLDATFFTGQYLLWNGLAVTMLSAVHGVAIAHVPLGFRHAIASLPAAAQVLLAIALGDLCVYWFHRASHASDFLWRFHAVHHSSERLDFVAAHREHPVDGLLTQLAQNLPAIALGVPMGWLAGLAAFRAMWAIFVHSNVHLPLGPLRWIFGAPELHHWHHARVRHCAHNYANLAPWLDALFGTHHLPAHARGEEAYPLGLEEPLPAGYLAKLAQPLRAIFARPTAQTRPIVERADSLSAS